MRLTKAHLLHRELLKKSLYAYVEWAWPYVDPAPFKENWHIARMCEYLQAVSDGEIPRLLINIPPGHQKSLTVSVFWPSWDWINTPSDRFMLLAYKSDLATRDAERTRNLIRSPEYQFYFGDSFQLRPGQDTKHRYENNKKGYRYSTSVPGIMGEGGKFVVFDDPHNVEEAESDEVRDETVRKINLGLPTRVRDPKGGIVVMMQRLHERDFSQSCIDSGDWVHLCLPAFYEYDHPHVSKTITLPSGRVLKGDDREDPKVMRAYEKYKNSEDKKDQEKAKIIANAKNGKLLFPSLFDEERLKSIAEPLGEYGQAGQLQQRPVPREGGMFKLKWFDGKYIDQDELPRLRVIVRGYDLAGTEDPKSPYTCGVRMSMDAKGNYYVEHVDRYKANPGEVEENIKARASTDGRTVYIDVPQDPGQAGKAQVKAYSKLLAGYAFSYSPESGSKVKRAEPFAAQAFAGNVYIVRGGWNQDYLDELIIFPGGSYADQVDASSRAFAKLLQLGGMVNIGIVSGSY